MGRGASVTRVVSNNATGTELLRSIALRMGESPIELGGEV